MTAPRIDVVMVRDPDYASSLRVFLDGKEVEFCEWSFDPGAGYEKEDYEEMRDSDVKLAPEFLKPVIRRLYKEMLPAFKRWSTGGWE